MKEDKICPIKLRPSGKDYLWGGNRLKEEYGKKFDVFPLAETWECSTHKDGPSFAIGGEFDGLSLKEILEKHPEFLGTHPRTKGELPILMKLIDAKEDLSVQVHPDDEYAMKYEDGQLGKTEMWYVLDAKEEAYLIYGLSHDVDKSVFKSELEKSLNAPQNDTTVVDKFFQKVPVHKGDLFYIEAGTIHAIGAGIVIAEVQESSNLTYRLFDYNREDSKGNRRELHIDKALEVCRLTGDDKPRQPMRIHRYKPGCSNELLCRCKYFEVQRMQINSTQQQCGDGVPYNSDASSFRALLCTEGSATISYFIDGKEEKIDFVKGECIFVPANSVEMTFFGRADILDVRC